MINETPCRHCTKRKINCHANCQEYLDYRKKADIVREQARKERRQDAEFLQARLRMNKNQYYK